MRFLPTGSQYPIRHGETTAVIAEVGANLRSFEHDGRHIVWAYPDDELPILWAGTTLVPWPNRIRDGKFSFDGEDQLLPLNEHDRRTALHGLAHSLEWRLVRRSESSVTLASMVYPQPGWPGTVRTEVTYTVGDGTLTVGWNAENVGTTALPFGYGCHPYFEFEDLGQVTVTIPFEQELVVDDRLLPDRLTAPAPEHDFRQARPLGATELDTAFTEGPAQWAVRLQGPAHTVTVWADQAHPWVQLYTHPTRTAIAVEPMTCGPDAFNEGITHADMLRLEPGDQASGTWGVRVG